MDHRPGIDWMWLVVMSVLVAAAYAVGQEPVEQGKEAKVEQPDPVQTPTEGMEIVETESGLKYIDIRKGDGEQPKPGASVKVHYSGWLEDGTLFDSSVKKGEPVTFSLDGVIKGWTEGVGSMRAGGKRKLIVPPDLGYGSRRQGTIPANATLIFEVELLDVVQPPELTPLDPSIAAHEERIIWKYWDLKVGDGESPQVGATVKMHYTIWQKEDKKLMSSSLLSGEPARAQMDQLFPGWQEGIATMKVGGKRRIELPPALALGMGGAPRREVPPHTTVVMEVELLDVENPAPKAEPAAREGTEPGEVQPGD